MSPKDNSNNSHFQTFFREKSLISEPKKDNLIFSRIDIQIKDLLEEIIKLINNPQNCLNDEIQEELAKILNLLPRLKKISKLKKFLENTQQQSEMEILLQNLGVAIKAMQNSEQYTLIKRLIFNSELNTQKMEELGLSAFHKLYQKLFPSVSSKILLGLILSLPLYIVIPIGLFSSTNYLKGVLQEKSIISLNYNARNNDTPDVYIKDYDMLTWFVTLSFIAGATGSIVSILSRLHNYKESQEDLVYKDSILPIWVGFFKPVIGGTFGILIVMLTQGGIIPLEFGHTNDQKRQDLRWMSLYSLAFVIGFSERLAKDIISTTEKRLVSTNSVNSSLPDDKMRS